MDYRREHEQRMAEIRAEIEAEGDLGWPPSDWPPDPDTVDPRLPSYVHEWFAGKRTKPPPLGKVTPPRTSRSQNSADWGRQTIGKRSRRKRSDASQ